MGRLAPSASFNAEGPSMNLTLTVMNPGSARGLAVPVRQSPFLIGRQPECQLRPNHRKVSGRHCAIFFQNGQAIVRDLGSTNGTYVNEEMVAGERPLRQGDRLRIGPVHFSVGLELPRPAASAPARTPAADDARDLVDLALLCGLLDAGVSASGDELAKTDTDAQALDVREAKARKRRGKGRLKRG